ncbi:nuclear transport factor 2 family protein [Chroococcidiopsis sp. CCMEE 29]|uniref:nuclear transport factor 2 family protein n=1 Tax=Chroococcidiopsis sp. CCMEE 29 TaxID=155894 RepID=UPI00202289EC|nr:nuclear transport factor 2 family protein [Chroococcidiopsis sp. CCMEE 29]
MATSNVELVQRMYECFNRGDMDTIRKEVFAPELVWRLPGHHPLSGTKQGAEEVIAFFEELSRSGIQVDLIGLDTFGEDTVVEVHRGHGTAANGAVLDARNCTHYQVREARIADVQVYISDQHAVDQFFNAVYTLKPIPDRLA